MSFCRIGEHPKVGKMVMIDIYPSEEYMTIDGKDYYIEDGELDENTVNIMLGEKYTEVTEIIKNNPCYISLHDNYITSKNDSRAKICGGYVNWEETPYYRGLEIHFGNTKVQFFESVA